MKIHGQKIEQCAICRYRIGFYCIKSRHSIHDAIIKSKISDRCLFLKKNKKPIDKVTIDNLQMVLRMCGYELPTKLIDNIIDLVELIEEKGDKVSIKDIENLKAEWSDI